MFGGGSTTFGGVGTTTGFGGVGNTMASNIGGMQQQQQQQQSTTANPNKDFEVTSPPDDSVSCMAFSPATTPSVFLIAGSWDNNVI